MKILQNWRVWVSKLKEPSHIQDNTQVYEEGKKKKSHTQYETPKYKG